MSFRSSSIPACPNCHGRRFLLVVPVCCAEWLHVQFLEAGWYNLHVLVLIVVTLHITMPRTITSFDSQTPMYVTVSLSDEYREVAGDPNIRSISVEMARRAAVNRYPLLQG